MIVLVGLGWSGIIVDKPDTFVRLGDLSNPPGILPLFSLAVTSILIVKRVAGAILIGTILLAVAGFNQVH